MRIAAAPIAPATSSTAPSRSRWAFALLLGAALWLFVVAAAHVLPQVTLGLRLHGWPYGLVGAIQACLAPIAITLALRPVGYDLRRVGLTLESWRHELAIGASVAIGFALMQFLLIIPRTGGAAAATSP